MGLLRVRAPDHAAQPVSAVLLGGLVALLSSCSASPAEIDPGDEKQTHVHLGESASYSTDEGARFSMSVKSIEQADECPSRVDPDTLLDGNFQILAIEADFDAGAGETGAVSIAPERFELYDNAGELVGGFNEATTWECYGDDELLPMLALPGQAYAGLVVLESAPHAVPTSIIFNYSDAIVLAWKIH